MTTETTDCFDFEDDDVLVGCDGPCLTIEVWCPECDCLQRHIYVSDFCVECTECGELSEVSEDFGK